MEKRWIPVATPPEEIVSHLSSAINTPKSISTILAQRGITNFDEARDFFRPEWSQLHDPFLMKGMDLAIERIEKALEEGEKIMIYGDYDVDGTTSVALTYSFFSEYSENLIYYIPDRYEEGYGISFQGIDVASAEECKLIIALDCGIRAVDKVEYATKKGIDFIICDHHLPGKKIPEAIAVLDPKQSDCPYPYKELSGCGIGFKLCQAFVQKNGLDEECLHPLLDLCAVSIASDIVPITGENRTLAFFGLDRINKSPREGLKSLTSLASADYSTFTITDLVFKIGPRINAAGRLKHAKHAVEVLLGENQEEIRETSLLINKANEERKTIDQDITAEALKMILEDEVYKSRKSTVVYQPEWHKGVVGIVASRILEHRYCPTIVLTKSKDVITGSARSVKDFDIHHAIDSCGHLLTNYGGHKYAAGLTMEEENLEEFINAFENHVASNITDEQLILKIDYDIEIELDEINPKFFSVLKQIAPFGPENMNPVFVARDVSCKFEPRLLKEKHLKLMVHQDGENSFDAIGFGMGIFHEDTRQGKPFDICFQLEENHFRGKTTIQLNLRDIKIK
ncbi:MAG: single-stranded-DNA-specific exonuclease [Sphingobacteriales bacterium]|jgi:single-stranded-DNA-specific exonuclease